MNIEKSFDVALAKRGMNKADFAKRRGVSASYISQVTTKKLLSLDKLEEMSKDLGFKVSEFIELGED